MLHLLQEAYIFKKPVSPHWAAEIDGKKININLLNLPSIDGSLVVETAGGLMVPITRNYLQIDQMQKWDLLKKMDHPKILQKKENK